MKSFAPPRPRAAYRFAALLSAVFLSFGAQAQQPNWPPLPDKGFISGHLASKQDVDNGNAVFATEVGGGQPLQIVIPQYAYWRDGAGRQHPVVVLQAEEASGNKIIGFRDLSGAVHAATLAEMTLLGRDRPN